MIKILLVDDHVLVRTALRNLLSSVEGLEIIAEAASGEEAVRVVRNKRPDVVVMDIQMPGIGGLEAARKMLRYDRELRILGLSACKEDPIPSRFVRSGGAGFVTKDAGLDELVRAIRDVHHGRRYLNPELAQQIALHHLGEEDSPLDILSERELQVMMMITNGQKVQEISERLCLSPKTVNSYRYRLFEKLSVDNDVELTHMAIKYGMLDVKSAKDEDDYND